MQTTDIKHTRDWMCGKRLIHLQYITNKHDHSLINELVTRI